MSTPNVAASVEIEAVVYPPCGACGQPYRPARPVENHGVVFFASKDWLANLLWRIEFVFQSLRKARLRSL